MASKLTTESCYFIACLHRALAFRAPIGVFTEHLSKLHNLPRRATGAGPAHASPPRTLASLLPACRRTHSLTPDKPAPERLVSASPLFCNVCRRNKRAVARIRHHDDSNKTHRPANPFRVSYICASRRSTGPMLLVISVQLAISEYMARMPSSTACNERKPGKRSMVCVRTWTASVASCAK